MTKSQGSKVNMFALIGLFFSKYNTALSAFTPLFDQITAFLLKEANLKDLLDQQGYNTKGKTMTKEMLRIIMIGLVRPMAKSAKGWAMTENNKEMLNIFDVSDDQYNLNQKSLVVLIDMIVKALEDNLTDMAVYNITAAKIAAAKAATADYVAAKNTPKQQKALKKTITALIKTEIKATTGILEICDTLMEGEFGDSAAEMVQEYQNGRKLPETVSRHTTIKAHVYGDEEHSEPVEDAAMSIESLNRHEVTNVDGEGEIVQFKGGDYELHFKAKGYSDIDVPFTIKMGKLVEIDVVMVPNIIDGHVSIGDKSAVNYHVGIDGTDIKGVTDDFGNYTLTAVEEGNGLLVATNDGGNIMRKAYTMITGQNLKIDFAF